MKKIALNKVNIIALTSEGMSTINGGGERRSDRLSGGCAYSRQNPEIAPCQSGGQQHVTGCKASSILDVNDLEDSEDFADSGKLI